MPRLKLITAERNRGGVARTYLDKHLGQIVVMTLDGSLYGGGGDLVWIAPVCTLMTYCRPESPAPRDPQGKGKGRGKGKRPPSAASARQAGCGVRQSL